MEQSEIRRSSSSQQFVWVLHVHHEVLSGTICDHQCQLSTNIEGTSSA